MSPQTSTQAGPETSAQTSTALRSPRLWLVTTAGLALVVAAVLVVNLQAPAGVRFPLGFLLLLGVGGEAAVRLVLGRSPRRSDPVLRAGLAVVLGLLMLLVAVLTLGVSGQLLTPSRLATAAGVAAGVLTLAAALASPTTVPFTGLRTDPEPTDPEQPEPEQPDPDHRVRRVGPVLRVLAGIVGAAVLLAGAVATADSLRPRSTHPSTALEFSEATRYQGTPEQVNASSTVTIGVRLISYASELSASDPQLEVSVGNGEPRRLDVSWLDVQRLSGADASTAAATDPTSERSGAVSFRAPSTPGLYRVLLATPSPRDGSDLMLTTYLEVRT